MSRPWMPLYVAEYRHDTAHLSAAEHGAYLLLIMHYWTAGGLPDDDRQLARIASMGNAEWRRARPIVQAFFHDGWRHKRIDVELARAADISSKRSASAKQKHSNSSAIAPANAQQLDTHARAGLQSQLQRREDTPDGVPSKYAFESGVIRLNQRDFDQWRDAFPNLDLKAELLSLTEWAEHQSKWFFAVSGALAKRNRDVGIRKSQNGSVLTPSGNPWPEGIT